MVAPGSRSSWLPTSRELVLATGLVLAAAAPILAAWALLGIPTALAVWLGSTLVMPSAATRLTSRQSGLLAVCAALAVGSGTFASARPVWIVVVLALAAALAQAPLNQITTGAAPLLPFGVVFLASLALDIRLWQAAVAAAAGAVYLLVLGQLLPIDQPPVPVPAREAYWQAGALALGCLVAIPVAWSLSDSHGAWLVLTLCMVLQPDATRTLRSASDRTIGTLLGGVFGGLLAVVLPPLAALVAAGVCAVGTVICNARQQVRVAVFFLTPTVILVASAGRTALALGTTLERISLTVAGSLLAVVLAYVLLGREREST